MKRATAEGTSRDGFNLEGFLPDQLAVTANRVSRFLARNFAEEFGLTIPEWRVLALVGRFEAISPSRVSGLTEMDKVKVSRAAATLVARGMLRQAPNPTDGRARVLRMTRKGERVHDTVVPRARELEQELASALSRTELAALRKALTKLHGFLDQAPGTDPEPD